MGDRAFAESLTGGRRLFTRFSSSRMFTSRALDREAVGRLYGVVTSSGSTTSHGAVASEPKTQPPAILSLTGISKRFGAQVAVENVSMAVRVGRIHGLLGPNGAGKTTTLRIILGMVRPDSGAVEFDGQPLVDQTPRGRCGIAGFVEAPNFYPYLSASRNLELLAAWDGPSAHRKVEELLEVVGLAGRAQSKVRGFSTGMRQRLGLAAALISEPTLLVVDEPTTGLDPGGIRDLHVLLRSLADAGHTILLSSHDLAEVEHLCTDVSVLRAGSVVYDGSMAALGDRGHGRTWRMRTSDDRRAVSVALPLPGVSTAIDPSGLMVTAQTRELDGYVLALAAGGVAVRDMRREELAFEALFFELTEPDPAGAPS